ncbi:hypothetical protein CYMTET_28326, partial [Cymbomonas tetramitiformis]
IYLDCPARINVNPTAAKVKLNAEEVAKHNTEESCWFTIDGKVYDATAFISDHPGGKKILLKNAGKDVSEEFEMLHPTNTLKKYSAQVPCLGDLE